MGRILVVDDSWQILKMLTKLLSNDYLVDTANDGKEALEKIDLNHSLVFTDCRMPNLEGWDLIKKLKTDPSFSSYANISIVGIGNGFFHNKPKMGEYLSNGWVNKFLDKPFSLGDILECAQTYCGQK